TAKTTAHTLSCGVMEEGASGRALTSAIDVPTPPRAFSRTNIATAFLVFAIVRSTLEEVLMCREIVEQILEAAASDEALRNRLMSSPAKVMREAGFVIQEESADEFDMFFRDEVSAPM